MERDYRAIVAALRRKAADPSCTPDEAMALSAKADALAEKYGVKPSFVTGPEVIHWPEQHADWTTVDEWPPPGWTPRTYTYTWPKESGISVLIWRFWNLDEEPIDYDWGEDPQGSSTSMSCNCVVDENGECLICDDPYNEDGSCECHN